MEAIFKTSVEVQPNLDALKFSQNLHQHLAKCYPDGDFKDLLLVMALLSNKICSKQTSWDYLAQYLSSFLPEQTCNKDLLQQSLT